MNLLEQEITEHFKYKEALYLGSWGIYVYPDSNLIWNNITETSIVLEDIRAILGGRPLKITSWYRPEKYNEFIGGAKKSMHALGLAVDFNCKDISCDLIRVKLLPHLEILDIRMEVGDGRNRVHIDLKRDVKLKPEQRFFKP